MQRSVVPRVLDFGALQMYAEDARALQATSTRLCYVQLAVDLRCDGHVVPKASLARLVLAPRHAAACPVLYIGRRDGRRQRLLSRNCQQTARAQSSYGTGRGTEAVPLSSSAPADQVLAPASWQTRQLRHVGRQAVAVCYACVHI